MDAMTVFNGYFFVLYAFVPINILILGEPVVRQVYAYREFGDGDEYTALSLLITYIVFYFGYFIKFNESRMPAGYPVAFNLRKSTKVAIIILILGSLAMLTHTIRVGGVFEVLSSASVLRSGEKVIESKFLFFNFFTQFLADAFTLFCVVLIGKKFSGQRIKKTDKVFLFGIFVLFVYYALSTGGRRPFIYPLLISYLVYTSVKGQVEIGKLALLLGLTFIIAGLGTFASLAIAGVLDSGLVEDGQGLFGLAYMIATRGLGDSFIHFVGAQHAGLWRFGFLTDIRSLPVDFFPSQLFGFERGRGMLGETTEFFRGYAVAEGMTGEEPLGLHGYLLVNFGYSGMFVLFFVLGWAYRLLHAMFKPRANNDAVGWLIYWWVIFGFFVYFREGAAIFVIKHHLSWWITIGLLYFIGKVRFRKANRFVGVENEQTPLAPISLDRG